MTRIALIYDDTERPETTGTYCNRALGQLADVTHFLPSEAARIPRTDIDLYLEIDDGLEHRLPSGLHPCAWWAIDTHLNYDWCVNKARDFDFLFAAQSDGAERLRADGIAHSSWLPLACDPSTHRKHEILKRWDWCFVGNLFPGERTDLVRLLERHFGSCFVGRKYFEEMARTFSASRLVFNRSIRNDVNMRVFEALACGSLLMTNDLADNGQDLFFQDGVHLATYRCADELLDKARYYLTHERERERIETTGRKEALARHSYQHRMEALLTTITGAQKTASPGKRPASRNPREPALETGAAESKATCGACDPTYFGFPRPELIEMIPLDARRVLDIGCAAGCLGEVLKARQQVEVTGIEFDEGAAAAAQNRLDRVIVGDAETVDANLLPGSFDVVVCGDVLEHLREPARVLRRARDWLQPEGRLIASIPNVRHHSIVRSLIEGNWTYEASGLLDRTHLRFFTRRGIENLFHLAGFRVRNWKVVPGPGHEEWARQGRPGDIRLGGMSIRGLAPEDAEEFFAYQYLVDAEPARPSAPEGANPYPEATPVQVLAAPRQARGPLCFRQDFIRDFEQFDFFGPPFAFARFGDGERAICTGRPIECGDGWEYRGGPSRFADELRAALAFAAPDYYLGISDGCCDRPSRDWYLGEVRVPLGQLTFANIFVNWNYRRFVQLDLREAFIVSSQGGNLIVPENMLATPFDIDGLVERLLTVERPILIAAGPASGIIIHKYWLRASKRQTIVDVGSAIDERIKGCKTRRYQVPGTRTAELICRW